MLFGSWCSWLGACKKYWSYLFERKILCTQRILYLRILVLAYITIAFKYSFLFKNKVWEWAENFVKEERQDKKRKKLEFRRKEKHRKYKNTIGLKSWLQWKWLKIWWTMPWQITVFIIMTWKKKTNIENYWRVINFWEG